jgi:hypothetical protein
MDLDLIIAWYKKHIKQSFVSERLLCVSCVGESDVGCLEEVDCLFGGVNLVERS